MKVFREDGTSVSRRFNAIAGTFALATILGVPGFGAAQILPPPPPQMEAVGWLEGEWVGEGWTEFTPGERFEFSGTERVTFRMGGRLLMVEGEFSTWMGPEMGNVLVHQALGIFSWNAAEGRYMFRTYTARGGSGEDHGAEVGDGTIVWGYTDPVLGEVRYTITRTEDGRWREVGDAPTDGGESRRRFFEMTLERR